MCFAKHIRVYLSYAFFSYGKPSRADAEFIDDARNAILLRSDVHKFFDDKRLAFVLKPSATSPSTTTLVVHIFIPNSASELINLYHNRSLQQLTGISVEYLSLGLPRRSLISSNLFSNKDRSDGLASTMPIRVTPPGEAQRWLEIIH